MKVRTRFAPSPTGYLHVGGIRTALYAWLVARQAGGQFVLRLEDTDKKREVAGADEHIMNSLRALGLDYDEGPDIGGPFAPYRQSERLNNYKKWAQKLIDSGRAYADPYTSEEVQAFREAAQKAKKPFLYRDHRPKNPPAWDGSQPLRFKSEPKAYKWHDEVMGDLSTGPEVVDDFILIKSDGYPTYNFAHIIDDLEMEISHVIRGQEFVASTPNYLNLYEAIGIERPVLATMPPILGPDGNKKLSKRDSAKDVLDYIREGFLPEALVSFIATMGWNDGSEQEVFTVEELIEKFSLDRVQRSGARFDERRLNWVNAQYIARLSNEQLMKIISDEGLWPSRMLELGEDKTREIINLIKLRLRTLLDIDRLSKMFYDEPKADVIKELMRGSGLDNQTVLKMLKATIVELSESSFKEEDIKARLNKLLAELETEPKVLFATIRIAVSGQPYSPELFGSLAVLGKETSLKRINQAVAILS